MKQALALLTFVAGGFAAVEIWLGHHIAVSVAFGAISILALMISATFLWLWIRRATPLALGMSFSWAGAALVLGWWWLSHILHAPELMADSLAVLAFLALYVVGAVMHFSVLHRSMGLGLAILVVPMAVSLGLAAALVI